MLTPFTIFGLYVLLCWLVIQWTERPLQPAQLVDDLTDVDLSDVHRQRVIRESCWWESPQVNLVLSRRRGRG